MPKAYTEYWFDFTCLSALEGHRRYSPLDHPCLHRMRTHCEDKADYNMIIAQAEMFTPQGSPATIYHYTDSLFEDSLIDVNLCSTHLRLLFNSFARSPNDVFADLFLRRLDPETRKTKEATWFCMNMEAGFLKYITLYIDTSRHQKRYRRGLK